MDNWDIRDDICEAKMIKEILLKLRISFGQAPQIVSGGTHIVDKSKLDKLERQMIDQASSAIQEEINKVIEGLQRYSSYSNSSNYFKDKRKGQVVKLSDLELAINKIFGDGK